LPQLFPKSSNVIARVALWGLLLGAGGLGVAADTIYHAPYVTGRDWPREQPVPFSHQHHAGDLKLDCRYCHTGVEKAAYAGMPATETCMTCHSQLFTDSPVLEPVRASFASGVPIPWARVNRVPDYVYFDHHIHVAKGVGCASCHGRVDRMPMTAPVASMRMGWCLDCHRAPEAHLRPKEAVFDMGWEPPADQAARGAALAKAYHVGPPERLTNCTTCHR
jgi:hypothetical protein